ncbi:protein kinase [Azoarcus olearius]|uniref:Protein kinase n=1 Tax=Azoarcus sp. (strain BH72) TaxID=418699 RepID=A1K753_AZOSB|nr:protein kinase [Azoarcus olearius]
MLKNVLIAEDLQLNDAELTGLWTPQQAHEAGRWQSQVRLSHGFFRECIENPVPIDLRAYKALRGSPLAMDVYTWLTYRMSYTHRRSRPIRWEPLMMQFGCDYGTETGQAVRDFRKAFLKALKLVLVVYPQAQIEVGDTGLLLLPSRHHVPPTPTQGLLF